MDQKEIYGPKQLCGYKKIQVQKNFGPKKIVRSEKNMGHTKIVGPKILFAKKFSVQHNFVGKRFLDPN